MSELDALTGEFKRILDNIQAKYSLEEWRHAYREILFLGAMKILKEFPEIIVGARPDPAQQLQEQPEYQQHEHYGPVRGGAGDRGFNPVTYGQRPPFYPSGTNQLVCIILHNCPQQG